MELYHGTNKKFSKEMIENKINVRLGGGEIGQGFYTGNLSYQASNWAYHKYKDEKAVVKFNLQCDDLLNLKPKCLTREDTCKYRKQIRKKRQTRTFRFNQNIVWAPVVGRYIPKFHQLKFESKEAETFLNGKQVIKTQIL